MGKLIELLNEYEPYIQKDGERHDNIWYFVYKWGSAIFPKNVGESVIISKSYWFIKWLVENDKIERRNYWNIYISDYCDDDIYLAYKKWEQWILHQYGLEDTLLMLLSISSSPIDDLISYLR